MSFFSLSNSLGTIDFFTLSRLHIDFSVALVCGDQMCYQMESIELKSRFHSSAHAIFVNWNVIFNKNLTLKHAKCPISRSNVENCFPISTRSLSFIHEQKEGKKRHIFYWWKKNDFWVHSNWQKNYFFFHLKNDSFSLKRMDFFVFLKQWILRWALSGGLNDIFWI